MSRGASSSQHVDLPQISVAHMEKRRERKLCGFSDALLEVFQFIELLLDVGTQWSVKASTSHHEDPFCADGQFRVEADQTDHVCDDLSLKLLLEGQEVLTDL